MTIIIEISRPVENLVEKGIKKCAERIGFHDQDWKN